MCVFVWVSPVKQKVATIPVLLDITVSIRKVDFLNSYFSSYAAKFILLSN